MRDVIEKTWGWDEDWQRRDFNRRFSAYLVSVIESEGRAVGGLLLDSTSEFIDIVELQILPEYQGMGIGTAVLRWIIEEGGRRGVSVTLSVVPPNARAKRLYERLGFEETRFEAPFIRMQHRPRLEDV